MVGLWWGACAASTVPQMQVRSASEMQDGSTIEAWVTQLADPRLDGRDEGSAGSAAVRRGLVDQLVACGVAPAGSAGTYAQRIEAGAGTNVLGRVGQPLHDEQILVLSAHYDHQDGGWGTVHPGAQDNAAAVAALLHVACRLAADPPPREVLIAFWDAEEPPTFLTPAMGSRWWHAHPTVPLERIGGVVVLDLLGAGLWPGFQGTFALGAETSPEIEAAVAGVPSPAANPIHRASLSVVEDLVVGPQMVWSDDEVFRNHGIPVLFVSDGQNARYHTPADTVEALDLPKLEAEASWLFAVARSLAEGPPMSWSPRRSSDLDHATVQALVRSAVDAAPDVWSGVAREALIASRDSLEGNPSPRAVRAAAQRLMCWAGPQASPFRCGLL